MHFIVIQLCLNSVGSLSHAALTASHLTPTGTNGVLNQKIILRTSPASLEINCYIYVFFYLSHLSSTQVVCLSPHGSRHLLGRKVCALRTTTKQLKQQKSWLHIICCVITPLKRLTPDISSRAACARAPQNKSW